MIKTLSTDVRYLKGVGNAKAALLASLGIYTVRDLVEHFPRRYEDRSQIKKISQLTDGNVESCRGTVMKVTATKTRRLTLTKIIIQDDSGRAELVFFNQPYLKTKYKVHMEVMAYGKVQTKFFPVQIVNPEIEILDEAGMPCAGTILPVYPANEAVSQRWLRSLIRQSLDFALQQPLESLPASLLLQYELLERKEALLQVHFPDNWEVLKKARERLAFEELYLLQCGLLYAKNAVKKDVPGIKHAFDGSLVAQFEQRLPFRLTEGQRQALIEIKADMEEPLPMQRMVQGDVGSGKTVVAAIALVKTVENGYQGAMMAPTEILAEQHYQTLAAQLENLGIKVALLTGSLAKGKRRELLQALQTGCIDIIIGTHALIQEDVCFHKLGLVITDEQHRFGVRQRAKLQAKGMMPDVLVMTATPIPRTMALTVYGDLDVSSIRQLPPGRKPIKTFVRGSDRRHLVYKFITDEIAKGRQAYIVCPLVDESEKIQAQSATQLYAELQETFFRNIACGLVHGKMKNLEKDEMMRRFYEGSIKVLFATTVIEVGVNVPNATIMVIEGAERFGLAQLHQLRGRIGRGEHQSYCILLSDNPNPESQERLQVMRSTNDGFALAEQDLLLRGPGHFFGEQQHGLPDLKIADIVNDLELLLKARKAAYETVMQPGEFEKVRPYIAERFCHHFDQIFQC